MDEDFFQKVIIALVVVAIILSWMNLTNIAQAKQTISSGMQCNEVVDKIYEQCREETSIEITTIKGRNTTLHYENGVCIIK